MNDDFLHRLRKAPPPQFLADLKSRLDRQAPLPRPRRSAFGRGVIVGFLVSGVAFAVTSLSITGLPTTPGRFLAAPVELLMRVVTGRGGSETTAHDAPIKAVPLGPAPFPIRVTPQPASATDVGPAVAATPGASAPAATHTETRTAPSGGAIATTTAASRVVVQRELVAFATANLNAHGSHIKFDQRDATKVFEGLCGYHSTDNPSYVVLTTRRITSEQTCVTQSHAQEIVEMQVGYQALVLVRSKLYGPLNLTARDLFLALARRVPNPAQPNELINNPYTTWNQVDPALPYDPIHFYGPARDSTEGQLIAQLLLDSGCNTFPTLVTLRERDWDTFETACRQLRTDTGYEETIPGAFPDQLNLAPTTLGITTLGTFKYLQDKLIANPVDGVMPDTATLEAQSYPAGRTLYLYSTKAYTDAFGVSSSALALLNAYVSEWGPAGLWGYFQPQGAVRPRTPADFRALKPVQFGKWQPEN